MKYPREMLEGHGLFCINLDDFCIEELQNIMHDFNGIFLCMQTLLFSKAAPLYHDCKKPNLHLKSHELSRALNIVIIQRTVFFGA